MNKKIEKILLVGFGSGILVNQYENLFSNLKTIDVVDIEENTDAKLTVLDTGINLQELVDGLNSLGVTPRDLISILQAIKASGALQAEIEVI